VEAAQVVIIALEEVQLLLRLMQLLEDNVQKDTIAPSVPHTQWLALLVHIAVLQEKLQSQVHAMVDIIVFLHRQLQLQFP